NEPDWHQRKQGPCIGDQNKMQVLIVAAPLGAGKQVWFEPGVPYVDALATALCIPGVYPPVEQPRTAKKWVAGKHLSGDRRLVDGALVRQNPLPALFQWLRMNPGMAGDLLGVDPSDT